MAHLHSARIRLSWVVKPSYGNLAPFLLLGSIAVLVSLVEQSAAHKPPVEGDGSGSGPSGPGPLIPGGGTGSGSGSGGVIPGAGGSAPGGFNPGGGGSAGSGPGGGPGGSGSNDLPPAGAGSGGEEQYGYKCAKTCEWWESNYGEIGSLSKGQATAGSTLAQAFGDAASSIFGGDKSLLLSLKDEAEDGFSQLGRHGTAAYLNALTSASFHYTPEQVKSHFIAALASKEAALKQSSQFAHANFELKVPNCH